MYAETITCLKKLPNQITAYVLKINQLQISALKASNYGEAMKLSDFTKLIKTDRIYPA
jgi:hypothetical protein